MAQNVTINKTIKIENNYYIQVIPPQTVPPQQKSGVMRTITTGTIGILFGVGGKWLWDRYNMSDKTKNFANKLFGDDNLRNELNNIMTSAKRNDCANTNPSADVSHSENITVNTNHSENDCSNTTETTTPSNAFTVTEEVKCNQQQTNAKADSLDDKKAECSEVVESSSESVSYSTAQENKADLGEQYAADMKCSPAEEQKKSASFQQKNKRKAEKKIARGAILYNPLLLPDLIRGFEVDLQQTALKVLYGLCQNKLFQCSEDCFLFWFGGESDTPKKAYQRISWQKSKLTLQYFMKQLYCGEFDKGQWEMVANVFKIRGKTIPIGDLGKNTSNVGDKDKQMIDDLIKQFKKEVKKIAPSSIK